MPEGLTQRQREILDYISMSIDQRGFPPTLREIGQHFGIRSTNGVNDHLKALERKGWITREDLKSRALRPVETSASALLLLIAAQQATATSKLSSLDGGSMPWKSRLLGHGARWMLCSPFSCAYTHDQTSSLM